MWVTFLIPKIEDGNNFGVSIQEDTLGEIRTVEAEAAAFYEQISRYFLTRGKIISKVNNFHLSIFNYA
jgi:proteasome activator subunit 3 (PA28 gamma)